MTGQFTTRGASQVTDEVASPLRREGMGLRVLASADPSLKVGARVPVQARFTLGRSAEAGVDWVVADPRVSGRHLTIQRAEDGDGWIVTDHGSRNGTFVDGHPLRAPGALSPGSVLRLGDTLLFFGPLPLGAEERAETTALVGGSTPMRRLVKLSGLPNRRKSVCGTPSASATPSNATPAASTPP